MMSIHFIKESKFIRFCLVGGFCTLIDAGIFYCFRSFTTYQIALISGYLISLCVNYFLTIFWTFKTKPNIHNAVAVILAHLFNLFVIRMGLMKIFVGLLFISDKTAYIPTLVISVVANYFIIKILVDRK